MARTHLIGLLLGTEEDWSGAFEALMGRVAPVIEHGGERHDFALERVTIEPFDLRAKPRHSLVIDRLAHWYYVPREWIKKVALMDGVYLLNNPFTFQAMEKHAAYCAMMRLGLKVPDTWLVPYKQPPADERFAYTAERYNRPFDLAPVAGEIGYPLYMKPFDGGAWVGVSRIGSPEQLTARYDESGQRLMHLQRAVDGFDVFARSLSIGAETMVMHFDPDQPLHGRYQVDHDFLSRRDRPRGGDDRPHGQHVLRVGVQLVRDPHPRHRGPSDRLRERVPGRLADLAALLLPVGDQGAAALVRVRAARRAGRCASRWTSSRGGRWPTASAATRRSSRPTASSPMTDFEVDAYEEFCARHLAHVDEAMAEYIASADFDRLLVETVMRAFPPHEHEEFVAHYRGLLGAWVADQRSVS